MTMMFRKRRIHLFLALCFITSATTTTSFVYPQSQIMIRHTIMRRVTAKPLDAAENNETPTQKHIVHSSSRHHHRHHESSSSSNIDVREADDKSESNKVSTKSVVSSKTKNGGTLPFASDIAAILKQPRVEAFLVGLVLVSSFCVAYGTLPDPFAISITRKVELVVTYIFATEFILRLWANFGKQPLWQYLTKPLVMVDIVVVILPLLLSQLQGDVALMVTANLPNWISSRSGLINLRLLRILRIQRILKDMETFSKFEEALGFEKGSIRPYQLQLARVLLSVFTLLSVSTGLIYTTEHLVNPDIPDYFTALYFGLTTLTTVGFGDITPVTNEGKLVVSGSILAGVAVIPAQAARFVEALLDYQKERDLKSEAQQQDKAVLKTAATAKLPHDNMVDGQTTCSNCGAAFHWFNASYCWSCGTLLQKTKDDDFDI